VITAALRRAILAAAGRPDADPLLTPGPAPGSYATSLPFRLSHDNPRPAAAGLAAGLLEQPWIAAAEVTGPGFVTVTVTYATLARLAIRIAHAGPACAQSDALAERTVAVPRPGSEPGWPRARAALAAELTARLAAAAGATITVHDSAERTSATLGPAAGTSPVPGAAEWTGAAERTSATLGPPATTGPVPEAVAFAGADAITYALARIPPEHPVALDPAAWARHVPANPAYAVRYAHSCAASTLRWAAALDLSRGEAAVVRPGSLAHPRERALLAALSWLPEQVARAARRGRPHEFAAFLEELAETYQVCRVACPAWPERGHNGAQPDATHHSELPGGARTVRARLWLAGAVAAGLAAGLELLGVGAPNRL
jgi:arginyl-tRNA synthetase